jgi:hypothetical protein
VVKEHSSSSERGGEIANIAVRVSKEVETSHDMLHQCLTTGMALRSCLGLTLLPDRVSVCC